MNTISILANISAILLALELLVIVVIVGAVIYFIRRGIRAARRAASPYVQQGIGYVYQAETLTKQASQVIITPQVQAISTLRGFRRALRVLREGD